MKVVGSITASIDDKFKPKYPYLAIKRELRGVQNLYLVHAYGAVNIAGQDFSTGNVYTWSPEEYVEKELKFMPLPAGRRVVLENEAKQTLKDLKIQGHQVDLAGLELIFDDEAEEPDEAFEDDDVEQDPAR